MAKFNSGGGMKGFVSLFKTKLFKTGLCLGLFVTSALIILAMLLGNDAGTFVIKVQNTVTKSIGLCTNLQLDENGEIITTEDGSIYTIEGDDTTVPGSYLKAPAMEGMGDYSPDHFLKAQGKYDGIKALTENGGYNGNLNLYVYTFYIVNTCNANVRCKVQLNFEDKSSEEANKNSLSDCIRVMTFCESNEDRPIYIYRKAEPNVALNYYDKIYFEQQTDFTSGSIVFNEEYIMLESRSLGGKGYAKYSVFFWIEGNDPDEKANPDAYYGTSMYFDMSIKIQEDQNN